jgi:uncharacterized protein (TIGR02757 family)
MRPGLKEQLDKLSKQFNCESFIESDPISVPHRFSKLQDIEIAAFFSAILAWGQRKTIIRNALRLMEAMDYAPHDFVVSYHESDLKNLRHFAHRTFQFEDLRYFLHFLQNHYQKHNSLEPAFLLGMKDGDTDMGNALQGFHAYFFSMPHPLRTMKHISSPAKNSACKRLNMFLRWMVRRDQAGVDFGLWNQIRMSQLLCPLDVHVQRTALELGLLNRKQADWKACLELTYNLKIFDPEDPVKYDYALFGRSLLVHAKE